MTNDDLEKNPFGANDAIPDDEERDTEVIRTPNSLLYRTRRKAGDSDDGRATSGSKPVDIRQFGPTQRQNSSVSLPVSTRLMAKSDRTRLINRLLIASIIVVGFILVLFVSLLHRDNALAHQRETQLAMEQETNIILEKSAVCIHELRGCVADVNRVTRPNTPLGLAPRNSLVERKRTKKQTISLELSEKREKVLHLLETTQKPSRLRADWKDLLRDVSDIRRLNAQLIKVNKEYNSALLETSTQSYASDPKLKERNDKRAQYLETARN
jgi:hypothetical protein